MSARQLQSVCAIVYRDDRWQLVTNPTHLERQHGVADLEGLCVRVVNDYMATRGVYLSDSDRQELIGTLMGVAWTEAQRYRRGVGDLRGFLYRRLRWRTTDWLRSHTGVDSRRGAPPVATVPLDDDLQAAPARADDQLTLADAARLLGFDPAVLSLPSRWALSHIALPLAHGRTLGEVAITERRSKADLEAALEGLQDECARCALASTAAG